MASVSPVLASLLEKKAAINNGEIQLMCWTNKLNHNTEKLEKQVKYEDKWYSKFDEFMDDSKDVNFKGQKFAKDSGDRSEATARQYADWKVKEYDAELSEELADLDIEYDTMKCMYETLLDELRAQKDAQQQLLQTNAQDTGLLGGG